MNLNTQQLVIASLTAIALSTLVSLTLTILLTGLHELEIFALYFNVISGVTGALAGLYMGKRFTEDGITSNEQTSIDVTDEKT